MTLIYCGPVPIHWLAPTVNVTEPVLRYILSEDEWGKGSSFKAQRRREEFLRSRYLIRRLTGTTESLLQDEHGAPTWPVQWTGSITHKDGFVGVALLPSEQWLSVGIDAEDPNRMRPEFASRLSNEAEVALLQTFAATHGWTFNAALTVLFGFKEALFKAHFPLGKRHFYFLDAAVESLTVTHVDNMTTRGKISARVLVDTTPTTPSGTIVSGHFVSITVTGRSFILTALALPR